MSEQILLWLFGAVITILGLVLGAIWKHKGDVHKAIFDRLTAQEKAFNDFRVEVAQKYVTTEVLDKSVARLEKAFVDGLHEVSTSVNNLATQFHEHQLEDRR